MKDTVVYVRTQREMYTNVYNTDVGVMLRSGAAGAPLQSEYGTEDVEEVDGLAADGAVRGVSGGVFVEILSRTHIALCETVINVIWVVFVVDYVVSLWLADDRWRWFKHNLFTLLTIALPMLRPLRLLRLLTVLHVLNRTSGMAVRGRITVYAVGAVGMLMYVGALAVYSVERGASGSTITDFGTALWWAFVTVTTVGYGDFSPVTFQGKIIAVVLMFTGIALIGIVTATLASWIVDQVNLETDRREDAREKEVAKEAAQEAIATSANPEIDLLREEVRELTATVAGLRTELERR